MLELQIEFVNPDSEEPFLSFHRAHSRESSRFLQYWQWRKQAPESCGKEEVAIAFWQGGIVGSVGAVTAPITFAGRKICAAWQQDSLVAPSARGKGIGRALVEKSAEGWDQVMAKGTSDAMYALRRSVGFLDVPNSTCLLRVLKPRWRKRALRQRLGEMAIWLWGKALGSRGISSRQCLFDMNSFDSRFDELALLRSMWPGLRPYKDSAYLNWRYFQCPARKYTVIGSTQAAAAAVLGLASKTAAEGWIVDLICDWRNTADIQDLLAGGVDRLQQLGAERIWAFATMPQARRMLRRLGFVATSVTPRFTMRAKASSDLPATIVADFWHGDGDAELYG